MEGVIVGAKANGKNKYMVKVSIAGSPDEKELQWPSNQVTFCGTLLPKRACEKSSQDPEEARKFKADICFSQHGTCPDG